MNDGLRTFLIKLCGSCPDAERENVQTVLRSLELCPLQLNFDDAKDLIGVDDFIEKKLESFFSAKPKYVPKEGSIPHRILRVLFDFDCTVKTNNGFTKSDLMREMNMKQPNFPKIGKNKSHAYDPLSSMKTLESHDLVKRINTNGKHQFALTDDGVDLCTDIFSQHTEEEPSQVVPKSCKMMVKRDEIEMRSTFDVFDALRRTGREFTEDKAIPIGSIWFVRDYDVYDTVVQFSQYCYLTNGRDVRKVSGSPFRNKFIVVTSKENETYSMTKLKVSKDFDVKIIFLDTPASVAQFLDELCSILDKTGKTIGSLKEIIALCSSSTFSKKVGDVWQKVLPFFPMCGPQIAASITLAFKTPDQLYQFLNDKEDPVNAFRNKVAETGQKPREETAKAIIKYFGHNM